MMEDRPVFDLFDGRSRSLPKDDQPELSFCKLTPGIALWQQFNQECLLREVAKQIMQEGSAFVDQLTDRVNSLSVDL